jgi:hypothetical protein
LFLSKPNSEEIPDMPPAESEKKIQKKVGGE